MINVRYFVNRAPGYRSRKDFARTKENVKINLYGFKTTWRIELELSRKEMVVETGDNNKHQSHKVQVQSYGQEFGVLFFLTHGVQYNRILKVVAVFESRSTGNVSCNITESRWKPVTVKRLLIPKDSRYARCNYANASRIPSKNANVLLGCSWRYSLFHRMSVIERKMFSTDNKN